MSAAQRRIVVVLGMHRSGTSTIARALQVLGVDLGTNLLPPAPGDNERGYWEDADVHALNMELLLALGHDWHTLQPLLPAELEGPTALEFRDRAAALLESKLRADAPFGFKDPRVSRLLPFWQSVFARLGLEASYAIVSRNPLSVAQSLLRRDAFDPIKTHYLWLEHTLTSLAGTVGARRAVVDYDRFLEDPERELGWLARGLGLRFDPEGAEFAAFRREFLSESMRHTRFTLADLEADAGVPPGVRALFAVLHGMASGRVDPDAAEVQSLLAYLTRLSGDLRPALAYMRTQEERGNNVAATLAQVQAHEGRARIEALESSLAAIRGEIDSREAERVRLVAESAARASQVAELGEDVVARERELVVLAGELAERDEQLRTLRAAWDELIATTWQVPRPTRIARMLRGSRKPRDGG